MRKIKVIKGSWCAAILFEYHKTQNALERSKQIMDLLGLFKVDDQIVNCDYCAYEDDNAFIYKAKKIPTCTFNAVATKKIFLDKKYSRTFAITINYDQVSKLILLAKECEISLQLKFYKEDGMFNVTILINEIEGDFINFNTKLYDFKDIKIKVAKYNDVSNL